MLDNQEKKQIPAFCDVNKCKYYHSGRCDIHSIDDFGDSVYASDPCISYERKAQKKFSITLTEDEVETLLTLLEPAYDEDGFPSNELYAKLYRQSHLNPAAANMYFINLYARVQRYGGPEEGGWYYPATSCEMSIGIDCYDDPSDGDVPDFTYLMEMLPKLMADWFDDDYTFERPDIEELIDHLNLCDWAEFPCGEGWTGEEIFVAIERQPGAQNKTEKQHYC